MIDRTNLDESEWIFATRWDPVGVKDQPNEKDEYDGYLGNMYELLVAGASDERIGEYLCWVVNERMGLPAKREDMAGTAAALRKIPLAGK